MSLEGRLDVAVAADAVEFAFSVANAGTEPVALEFRDSKIVDVAVYRDDEEVWRWSEGQMFAQALRAETLEPGESFTRDVVWEGPQPGAYTAEATLEATNQTLSERTGFEVGV